VIFEFIVYLTLLNRLHDVYGITRICISTGGIGGVHRGAESCTFLISFRTVNSTGIAMDISADLTELARTPVAVVCAGVKSILDIGRTLEYLETQGVSVATVGNAVQEFPAFYTPNSGFKVFIIRLL
jgi:pseudouridine-5'-phosphate glycosidase